MDNSNPEEVSYFLIKVCITLIDDACKKIKEIDNPEPIDWDTVDKEVAFFCFFCVDYFLFECPNFSPEQKLDIRKEFFGLLINIYDDDKIPETLVKTFRHYSCILNQESEDSVKFSKMGFELTKRVGLYPNLNLIFLAPDIFLSIMNAVYRCNTISENPGESLFEDDI